MPVPFWGGLVALLVAEVLVLTARFDGKTLGDPHGWVAGLVDRLDRLVPLGICAGAVFGLILFGSSRDGGSPRRFAAPVAASRRSWTYLLGHLVAFGLLVWLTRLVFERLDLSANPLPWVALWLAAGLATLSLGMLAALPLPRWGWLIRTHWKALLFAALAGAAALALGRWTSSLWDSFRGSTFWAVRGVLGLFYGELVCAPRESILGTPRFPVVISPECSGFEGIGLIWVFLGASLWWLRHELRFPQAFLLLPLGTVLSWGFNVLRIAALIGLGDRGWGAVATGGFHSQAGWFAFIGIALGLIILSRRTPWISKAAAVAGDVPVPTVNPTAAYVAPLVAIGVTSMVTLTLSEGGFDRLYAARVLAAAAVFWAFRRHYGDLRCLFSWHAVALGLAVFAMWTALEPHPTGGETEAAIANGLARMPRPWAWAWLAARVIGSVVTVPLAEELAFRGFLTRRLIASDFESVHQGRLTWPSFLISSLLFGLLHQRWLAGTIAGMAYALIYYRRGKLIDAVAAHATTNLAITVSVLTTGEWYRWS